MNGVLAVLRISCLCLPLAVAAGGPPPEVQAEIDHLLHHLGRSECQFYRNGSWHDGAAARAHLDKKYAYLVKKGRVQRAEDFIAHAASESSVSREPYLVQCGDAQPRPSAQWFADELRRHRQSRMTPPP